MKTIAAQAGFFGILLDIVLDPTKLFIVSNAMIERFALPEGSGSTKSLIDVECRVMQAVLKRVTHIEFFPECCEQVYVIGHDDESI